ncbi:MAG: hypothetical protein RL064_301 [Bacteroidota bacterium]|jgi:hypothetical protein
MNTNLVYTYKDENWEKEWQVEALPTDTLMDLFSKNPDRDNGCQCEISLLTLEKYTYQLNLFGEDLPYDDLLEGDSEESLSLELKIQMNDVDYYDKSETQLIQIGQLFEMKLRQYRNEIAAILTPLFSDADGSEEQSSIDMSCECVDEQFIITFYIHIAQVPSLKGATTLDAIYEQFVQLHGVVNKANEVAKLF